MGKTRILAMVVAAAAFGAVSVAPVQAAKSKTVVVATDPDDDWGSAVNENIAPAGDALGQELVEASIGMADKATVNFIIKVKSLPAIGGVPEFTRYVWTVMVDGELLQIDGKFTNYSRGTCDPTAGTCPPPRNPGMAPFMVRANCTDNGGAAVTCEEVGLVNGTFDAGAGTITVPVSLELLGAKKGSRIEHGIQPGSNFAGVWAISSAWFSQGNMPLDEMILTKPFIVPKR
ncbi:MAG: hypothetical protein M3161_01265 [Actinomycetota bacterium]|nr:hypothetical protein [Actinomycetota bacterium]